jgi:hypothetical protein
MVGQSFYSLGIENELLLLSQSMHQAGAYLRTSFLRVRMFKKAGLMGCQMIGGLMLAPMVGLQMRLESNGLQERSPSSSEIQPRASCGRPSRAIPIGSNQKLMLGYLY